MFPGGIEVEHWLKMVNTKKAITDDIFFLSRLNEFRYS